jgi:hypothetical protein
MTGVLSCARPPATRRLALSCITALLATMLAGCAGGGSSPTGAIAHPTGDALILRIATEGGFIPPGATFSQIPSLSVYGDGRIIEPGAVTAIFPGPALPPLLVRRLSEAGIQAVLREVTATGLFAASQRFEGAGAFVADAATTVFTLHAGGRDVTVSVYALGTFDTSHPPEGIGGGELAAHRALGQLSQRLTMLDAWLPPGAWVDDESRAFAPDAFRLLVRRADSDAPDQSGIANQLAPWPGAGDPATFGEPVTQPAGSRCGVVIGAEAATWFDALRGANQLTRFTADGHRYQVTSRPLLPDEPRSCAGI